MSRDQFVAFGVVAGLSRRTGVKEGCNLTQRGRKQSSGVKPLLHEGVA